MAQKTVERTPPPRMGKPKKTLGVAHGVISSKTTMPEASPEPTKAETVVVFTSYDGTVRGVGDLPPNLGRATALANEKSVSNIWGTAEEEAACHVMREEI